MRIVLQRVSRAQVRVEEKLVSSIERGFLLLVAVEKQDTEEDLRWCARKVSGLRVFPDDAGKMNRDLQQVGGAVLAVSQFTLVGSVRRGRRPSFEGAAPPEKGRVMFDEFVQALRSDGLEVSTGVFGAHMEVELLNDGPVTLILDSCERNEPRRGGGGSA